MPNEMVKFLSQIFYNATEGRTGGINVILQAVILNKSSYKSDKRVMWISATLPMFLMGMGQAQLF